MQPGSHRIIRECRNSAFAPHPVMSHFHNSSTRAITGVVGPMHSTNPINHATAPADPAAGRHPMRSSQRRNSCPILTCGKSRARLDREKLKHVKERCAPRESLHVELYNI
jgi:hypothetical protein